LAREPAGHAGRFLAPCYLTSSLDEKGFAGGGLWRDLEFLF
jgi:hypothetical protein